MQIRAAFKELGSKGGCAAGHARNAIKPKETDPGVYIVLGYALLRQKKADDARHAFQHFLKYDPSSPNGGGREKPHRSD